MDVKNLVMAVVGMVLAAVMIGGALLPAVGGVLEDERTFSNRTGALYDMSAVNEDTDYSFYWDSASPTIAKINGVDTTLSNGSIICGTDKFALRFGSVIDSESYYIQSIWVNTIDFNIFVSTTPTDQQTLSITIEGKTLSAVTTGPFGTISISETMDYGGYVIMPSGKGDYVMKSPSQDAYVLDSSPIYAMGVSYVGELWNYGVFITGNVKELDITSWNMADTTISNVVIDSTVINGYDDLNTIKKITFDLKDNVNNVETPLTYDFFIVPAEVTAYIEGSGLTAPISALFNALPLIAVAGLVMAGIYVFISRK